MIFVLDSSLFLFLLFMPRTKSTARLSAKHTKEEIMDKFKELTPVAPKRAIEDILEDINAGILKNNIYQEELIELKRKKLKLNEKLVEFAENQASQEIEKAEKILKLQGEMVSGLKNGDFNVNHRMIAPTALEEDSSDSDEPVKKKKKSE